MLGFGGFDRSFGIISLLGIGIFAVALFLFVYVLVRALRQHRINNHSPRLTVEARVVGRRANTDVSQHPVGGDVTGAHGFSTSSTTTYYVTFEVESGDRMEFIVPQSQYGYIAEGDYGKLTFQGTRFLDFQRR